MAQVQYYGTGRRKSSVARVRLIPGKGQITINGRAFVEYIPSGAVRLDVLQPLTLTGNETSYDVVVNVCGGGISGQAGAIRHGITRALLEVHVIHVLRNVRNMDLKVHVVLHNSLNVSLELKIEILISVFFYFLKCSII